MSTHLRRPLTRAAAVVALALGATGLAVATRAPALADPSVRAHAVCEHRLCLVLTDLRSDSDGDGWADVDERAAGTDPADPTSHPGPGAIVELIKNGELPSFTEGLTAIAVLPQFTPEGSALATGLGALTLRPNPRHPKTWVTLTGGQDLLDFFKLSGRQLPTGIIATVGLTGQFNLRGIPWRGAGGLVLARHNDASLYSAGTPGSGRGSIANGSVTLVSNNAGGIDYNIHHDNGTTTAVWQSPSGATSMWQTRTNDEGRMTADGYERNSDDSNPFTGDYTDASSGHEGTYDDDGNVTSRTDWTETTTGNSNTGEYTTTYTETTTFYDGDGNVTGSEETVREESVKDGVKTVTEETTTKDAQGNVTDYQRTQTTEQDTKENDQKGGEMCDCDPVSFTFPLSPDEQRALTLRMTGGTITNFGPDNGTVEADGSFDPNARFLEIAYVTEMPGGITIFHAQPQPPVTLAQPEVVEGLWGAAGIDPPVLDTCPPSSTDCFA